MGIRENKEDGTYLVSYSKRHPKTKLPCTIRRTKVKTKAEAKRVYDEIVVQVHDKLRQQSVPTWSEVVDVYLKWIKTSGLKNSTIYGREKMLLHHTIPVWERTLIDQISTRDIHSLLNERFSSSAESHKKYFIKCIRGVFRYALEHDLIMKDPTPLLKFKINEKIKSVLSEAQIVHLLKKAQEFNWHWYYHYAVALYTGMRNGELFALTWDKISLDRRQILVNCSWTSKDGFKSTKSGDDRIVEIPKPLIPILTELKLKSAGSDFVLPRMSKWDKGEQARELRMFLQSIGLHQIRFHDLRASWATLLLGKGVPASQVMAMGGWRDMKTMMIYMRKAGIDIQGSTGVLDDMQVHGIKDAKILKIQQK